LNIDLLIYSIGAFLIVFITTGFVIWGFKTNQFKDNDNLKQKPLEDAEEE
jgi:nitrogen fixation-related uncharacterized protein